MVIFNSYVKLPEGSLFLDGFWTGYGIDEPSEVFFGIHSYNLSKQRWFRWFAGRRRGADEVRHLPSGNLT